MLHWIFTLTWKRAGFERLEQLQFLFLIGDLVDFTYALDNSCSIGKFEYGFSWGVIDKLKIIVYSKIYISSIVLLIG